MRLRAALPVFLLLIALMPCVHAVPPKIAAGWNTFALKSDGTLVGMGSDAQGQLGLGRSTIFTSPLKTFALTQIRAIAAGSNHSVALGQDGTVWTWGFNTFGQLGNGTSVDSMQPSRISGISGVVSVAAGFAHTLALKQDGSVWAWGSNLSGQVGGPLPIAVTPVQVTSLANIKMIAAESEGDHSLVLRSDGTVWAWGSNSSGQLGDGSMVDRGVPVQVKGLSNVSWIAAGEQHSLAIRADGTVWAWGSNSSGQLGDSTTMSSNTPVQVTGLVGVMPSMVAAGSEHSLLLTRSGAVWAWGANSAGRLGDGTTVDRITPVLIPSLDAVTMLAAGGADSFAVMSDGSLWAWGVNIYGELGDGSSVEYRALPTKVPSMTAVAAAAGSLVHTLILKQDGTVWASGLNAYGQLGIGNAEIIDHSVPVAIPNLPGTYGVSAGPMHTLALLQDYTVRAWGNNIAGQLGDGSNADRTTPVQSIGLAGITAVGAGGLFSVALRQDGTIWTWGSNRNGQLGDGTNTDRITPGQVTGLSGAFSGIAAGYDFAVAVKQDGTVWAWGANTYGQLGDGTTTDRSSPVQVAGLNGVTAVSAGYGHSIALKSDGTVWAWGYNYFGQLGDGSQTNRLTPVQAKGLANIVATSAGLGHSMALTLDGKVFTWGSNVYGELGSGIGPGRSTPAQVVGLPPVAAITASTAAHSVALGADGTIWTWGHNGYGQLGDGTFNPQSTPVLAINETVTGFLDLAPEIPNLIPSNKIPPFLVATYKYGGATTTTLSVDLKAPPANEGFASRGNTGRFAASYNVYVAAGVPLNGSTQFFQLDSTNRWSVLAWPMAEFLRGVALDSQGSMVRAEIFQNVDLSQLIGASIIVGYGIDPDEMLRALRYRTIFTVLSP